MKHLNQLCGVLTDLSGRALKSAPHGQLWTTLIGGITYDMWEDNAHA